jgi:VIT1/CCC1 family predicted Fe2+/Mn2+ transporter
MHPPEQHLIHRVGWLRAAVLGANDGIISTASLVVGVAAAAATASEVLVAGMAGLVAGAMSMAAGEYVSVSSQADSEKADMAKERRELAEQPAFELEELTRIYMERGLDRALAEQVARQLTEKDAFSAHLRDELGITDQAAARPVQAALTSAMTFAVGAALPVVVAVLAPTETVSWWVSGASLIGLGVLGAAGAWLGGAEPVRPTVRVMFWGAMAMAATAIIGSFVGHAV